MEKQILKSSTIPGLTFETVYTENANELVKTLNQEKGRNESQLLIPINRALELGIE